MIQPPMIRQDLANHFIYGRLIFTIAVCLVILIDVVRGYFGLSMNGPLVALQMGFVATLVAAAIRELGPGGNGDPKDWGVTVLGAVEGAWTMWLGAGLAGAL